MFTGIVEETGYVKSFDDSKLVIGCNHILDDIHVGDSISVNGCCETVVSFDKNTFSSNVSSETLKVTKGFKTGETVNLERALMPTSRMGGHIVQGHIDGVAVYLGNSQFEVPQNLVKYIVYKGAVTINGISLTVSKVENNIFSVAIIPHTYSNTNLKDLKKGDYVNIETDILGRYIEKFLSVKDNANITVDFLAENGFV